MRKLVAVVAVGLLGLFLALMASPASAELKTSISGSIRLNVEYSDLIANNNQGAQEIAPTNIPFNIGFNKSRVRDNDQLHVDARRTRLQLDMSDQVGSVKLAGRFQGDFDTTEGNAKNSNSRHFRIRLGWGQWQTASGWIVRFGQMRSMVSEFGDNLFGGVGDPDLVDENGHWDQLSARQPGVNVGYATKFMGGDLLAGVGVENAASDVKNRFVPGTVIGLAGTGAVTGVDESQSTGENVPMFGAAARLRTPLWAVFARAATQKHRLILGTPTGGPKDGSTRGYQGWLGALAAEVTPGPLRIMGQYWYGDGLNRLGGVFSDVSLSTGGFVNQFCSPTPCVGSSPFASPHILPIITHNWHVGAEYKLTKDLKATGVYEIVKANANRKIFDLTGMSADKRSFQAVHVGLIYGFWERFDTGIEYEWGKVKSFGSSEGILNAINWRLRFYF